MFGSDLPLPTDRLFQDSPDTGDPTCLCSRCLRPIPEEVVPIRVFVDKGSGSEYRYHPACLGLTTGPARREEDD